jgi:HD superfamily phosphohydrolase
MTKGPEAFSGPFYYHTDAQPMEPLNLLRDEVAQTAGLLLSGYTPRRYRDSKVVRDVVWGMINILPHELAFIDSPIFQRLRGVHQTSLALLTYPCAGHSRFEHSLGCLAVADQVLRALERRIGITQVDRLTIRLAALLHDCTHGPFSHTSESFYKSNPIFMAIRSSQPALFQRASASEILTYCLITSDPFKSIWEKTLEQYPDECGRFLSDVERWKIATMIVGADENPEYPAASPGPEHRYLRQLINGPFDVDKLDYVARDGYFTGLSLAIDVERLLWVLDTIVLESDEQNRRPRVLCVSASGATVLEQILFSKMQLYSSVYHHHKVRVAHQAVLRLLAALSDASVLVKGLSLDKPSTYLCLDDSDILHASFQGSENRGSEPEMLLQARQLTNEIRNRTLPMRALVLTHPVWGADPRNSSDADRTRWEAKMKASGQLDIFAAQVAGAAGVDIKDVWADIPGPAPLEGTAQEGFVKFDDHTCLAIGEMFPIGGWISGYQAFRTTSYVFARHNRE